MGSTLQDGASECSALEIPRMYVVYTVDKIDDIVKLTDLSKNEN